MVRCPCARSITGLAIVSALLTGCDQPESLGPTGSRPEAFVVSIAPGLDSVDVGATLPLTATVTDSHGTVRRDQPLTWSSAAPLVASVDNVGVVTGISVGTAHVIARTGAYADTATIIVREGSLVLSVAPELIEIINGDSIQLQAYLSTPSGAAVRGLAVRWETSDSSIAAITEVGLVSSRTPGDVALTASVGGTTAVALARVIPNPPVSVSITPANSGIYPGQTVQLTTNIRDIRNRDMRNMDVLWSSSEPNIASVSQDGLVTGKERGTVIITARTGRVKASATVNVFSVPAASVVVSAPSNTVTRGAQLQATAVARDANGNVLAGKVVGWSSSNPSVAQVNSSGLITGLAVGSTTINAVVDSKIGTLAVSVIGANPTSMSIVPGSATIPLGATATLTAEVKDQGGNVMPGQSVSWSSASPSIATVNSLGLVTAIAAGTATIQATSGTLSAQATITVTNATIASVSVSPSTAQLAAGGTQQLTAQAYDASGNQIPNAAITWGSSNPTVASVSAMGLVTAVGTGNATISATASGKTGTAAVSVAAPPPAVVASVTVTFNSPTLTVGQSTQATAVARDASGNIVTGRTVTWASDDALFASVSATGLVTALASGTAAIVARIDGVPGFATVTISPQAPLPVYSVQLTVSPSTINAGQTASSSVVLRDSLGRIVTGQTIGWSSSRTTVASVGLGGVITGVSAGSATITASSQGKSGTAGITVNGTTVPVASVTVSAPSTSLTVGQTTQATAVTKDANGNVLTGRAITWSSSNSSVATVSTSGLVTAVAAGSAQILASSGGQTGSVSISVASAPAAIVTVTVTLANNSIVAGSSTQASAVAKDASGNTISGVTFFWGSSSASNATVSQGGVVVGVAAGSATISASAAGKMGSATVTVTAPPPSSGLQAIPPALPNAYVNTTYTQPTGRTINVPAGGNLQTAIDQAQRGDVITLQPGATYTGNFILRANKAGTGYVTIRTAVPDAQLPPQGSRLTPSRYASILPRVQTGTGAGSVFVTEIGASGYRLLGLEITAAASVASLNALVQFGDGSSAQNTLAKVARDLIIDRSWVHGTTTIDLRRCVTLNSAWSAVVDSYLADCHSKGSDSQAIIGWNGPGPFKIVNNYLEGAGENVMFGGADPYISGLNPSDIEIRGNHFYKPVTWSGGKWTVKNLLETKQAVRVLVEDNIFEGCWIDGQTGFAIVFKSANQSGGAPWAITSDVTFRNNVVRNAAAGLSLAANPGNYPAQPAARFLIEENIFEGIGNYAGTTNGRMIMMLEGLNDVEIRHNTLMHNAVAGQFILMDVPAGGKNLVVRNNVATWGGPWGAVMGTAPQGSQALAAFMSPYAFEGNVVVGMPVTLLGGYPTQNFYPTSMTTVGLVSQTIGGNWSLLASSPFKGKGTDGRDPGADVANVRTRTGNVIVP